MSFSSETKAELCREPLTRKCCAQAEAYGALLYCNSFSPRGARVVTESAALARRLPLLFKKAFKVEFDQLKAVYDKEITEKKAALDAQRAVVAQKAAGIDPRLMEEYNVIKKHIMPPMARLVGNQCSGCNTAQPSSLLSKIKSGAEIVECETCGRMIIQ